MKVFHERVRRERLRLGKKQADVAGHGEYTTDVIADVYGKMKLDNPRSHHLLQSGILNFDWSWNETEEGFTRAFKTQYGEYNRHGIKIEDIQRFRKIMFYNMLLEDVYPLVVKAFNYLEDEKYEQEWMNIA